MKLSQIIVGFSVSDYSNAYRAMELYSNDGA